MNFRSSWNSQRTQTLKRMMPSSCPARLPARVLPDRVQLGSSPDTLMDVTDFMRALRPVPPMPEGVLR